MDADALGPRGGDGVTWTGVPYTPCGHPQLGSALLPQPGDPRNRSQHRCPNCYLYVPHKVDPQIPGGRQQ